ncbi:site-specific DNA-methyltransferase [Ferrovum sp.]|uniref:site-specific DNA-methyltransferase n=1 Tax=Ferrovum sp. TaxID=2609467 RepID=UPI00261491D9|nr:site-specific DNA-methyltransferase [Ferrovum sp.]
MQKIDATSPEAQSADLVAGNIEQLKAMFPELITESANGVTVNVDVLKTLVGDQTATDADEKYGLNWHGKRRARQLALTPSTGTLRPRPDESVDWDTTQNLMIEGDNLEVLKLLQKSYAGKVKLIYIDPPYNTGKDFVYPDNFQDNIKNYLELTGQVEGGQKISSNTEASGRFHTDWLNMMYPRLKLARNLLRDDGVILVSIDDVEFPNLRRILDEVFGEENFIASLVWDRNRKNDAKYFSVGHEYMAVYVKNESVLSANQIIFRGEKDGVEEVKAEFDRLKHLHNSDWSAVRDGLLDYYRTIPDDDPKAPLKRFTKVDAKGPYRDDGNINWPGGDGPRYEVLHPDTKRPCKLPVSGWRYPTPERFWEEVAKGRIVFGADETTVPRVRTNLFENTDQVMVSVHYSYAQTSANEFNSLFDGKRVFDNPKPVSDLRRLTGYLTGPDDLVCDFFAGSGTTGHAVLAQNAVDGGNRRYILAQLPEPLDMENKDQKIAAEFCDQIGKPRTIAELTKERLRRAAAKVKADNPMFSGDTGFRVFKLDHSNIRAWNPNPADLEQTLFAHQDHLVDGRTESDILYELLLKFGLDLCVPIEQRTVAAKDVHAVGGGVLMACLAPIISREEVEALAQGIIAWHKELAPAGDTTCVFRDSAFADDVAKTNLAAILEQYGIQNVRSL